MKKLIFLFVLGFLAVQINAQKACCAKDAKVKTETSVKSAMLEANVVAANDDTIEKRENEETGEVSYFKKVMNEESGATEYQQVAYNNKTKSFVTIDPAVYNSPTAKKACCVEGEKEGKACCASKKVKGEKTSVQSSMIEKTEAKSMKECSSKKEGKACCASKKAKAEKS